MGSDQLSSLTAQSLASNGSERPTVQPRHVLWVRLTHWAITVSFLTLAFTGFVILMSHPRLYWGETGNDLTLALFELPISKNFRHGGWTNQVAFYDRAASPVSASRTFEIFNKNGWGRSLHFLAAWLLVLPGAIYLLAGFFSGHFRRRLLPGAGEWSPRLLWRDFLDHLRSPGGGESHGSQYGLVQKISYLAVVFLTLPLMVVTGLGMSPAISAAYPFLSGMFGGLQSARTIHFFAFVLLLVFLLIHLVMVIRSGFKRQMRAMTVGG